jgi:hypothetical protein
MFLLIHIIIALSSLAVAGYAYLRPTHTKLHITYAIVAATLITGTILLIQSPGHMTSTCLTGLVYLGFVMIPIAAARHKLTHKEV